VSPAPLEERNQAIWREKQRNSEFLRFFVEVPRAMECLAIQLRPTEASAAHELSPILSRAALNDSLVC
jgi:hypothetical protein